MQLSGKTIFDTHIVYNVDEEHAIQQQGVDCRIKSIKAIDIEPGCKWPALGADGGHLGKEFPDTFDAGSRVSFREEVVDGHTIWTLFPGYYSIELMEGCNMPSDVAGILKTRSTLVRMGCTVHSGQYDAGFQTDSMGCFLEVRVPICIEKGARITQFVCHTSEKVENLYNGSYQGKKAHEEYK